MTDPPVGKDAAWLRWFARTWLEEIGDHNVAGLERIADRLSVMEEALDAMLAYDLAAARFKGGGCDYATLNEAGNRKEAALAAVKLEGVGEP